MSRLSIIVPVYNAEKELPECLDAIISQKEADFELLLIDDGSKDNSWQVVQEYAQKDSRITRTLRFRFRMRVIPARFRCGGRRCGGRRSRDLFTRFRGKNWRAAQQQIAASADPFVKNDAEYAEQQRSYEQPCRLLPCPYLRHKTQQTQQRRIQ